VEARQRKLVVLFLAASLLVGAELAPSALRGPDGTATGTLTLNGATVHLRHAYASAQPGFFDKKAEDIRVLLSDVPLDDAQRADVFELIHLARDGKARIVEVILNAEAEPISGAIFAPAFEGMVSVTGMHRFDQQSVDRARISGRLSMDGPRTFQAVTFEYAATFSAPIPRPPTAEELAASLASPPAQAATAYLEAIRSNRLPVFLDSLTSSGGAEYRGPNGAADFAALRADTPPDSKVIGLATPTPENAIATVNGTRDGIVIELTIELALERGVWKVAR
jgi:hypothetical protein